ncbi:unnamed protein product [Peronospora destructor]|uniref:Secreted protein n=1 Tax=Peronospora destructor TaxID=86335 RepID=A0AAV0V6Q7_9STRA|nr:unnamed protein product [Peronospora destructor]
MRVGVAVAKRTLQAVALTGQLLLTCSKCEADECEEDIDAGDDTALTVQVVQAAPGYSDSLLNQRKNLPQLMAFHATTGLGALLSHMLIGKLAHMTLIEIVAKRSSLV